MTSSSNLIILTGFSGTGKSAVGRQVAASLGWPFVDTDQQVVARTHKTIADIFATLGQDRFRELEREALQEACSADRAVISTGGGTFLDPHNRDLMLRSATVVCLEATPETIHRRLKEAVGDGVESEIRPLLTGPDPLERIRTLKADRQAAYACANWTVHTDALAIDQVAAQVLHGWRTLKEEEAASPSQEGLEEPATVVRTSSGSYPVYVGWGLRERLADYLAQVGVRGPLYIVTDQSVLGAVGRSVQTALQEGGVEAHLFSMPAGESSKSLEVVRHLYQWLVERRAERSHAILAVGGGVVGDLAGFVAATFVRGMALIQMPTSLAAMVDASIGGKVAVNLPQGKNLVGAFYQPRAVIADLATLSTLPERERVAGWTETIKHGLILDEQLVEEMERHANDLLALEREVTARVVRRSVVLKAGVVTEDERETTGRRAILNYGHTVGHALEAATEYGTYLHGEAIAIGMTAAAEIGRRLEVTPDALVQRQSSLLERFGLPQRCPGVDLKAVLDAMELDKKTSGGDIRWVLLEGVARPVHRARVPQKLVRQVLEELSG